MSIGTKYGKRLRRVDTHMSGPIKERYSLMNRTGGSSTSAFERTAQKQRYTNRKPLCKSMLLYAQLGNSGIYQQSVFVSVVKGSGERRTTKNESYALFAQELCFRRIS